MEPELFCFIVLFASGSASPLFHTVPLAFGRTYFKSLLPIYNHQRFGSLPIERYPPGVDPVKCPNYPFCGTDAASVIVPQLPIPPFVSGVNPFVHPTVVSPFVDQTASHFVDPSVNVVSPVAGSIVPPIVEPITGEASIIEPDSWSKPNVGVASILDPTVKSLQLASITGFPGFYVRRVW